MIDPIMEIKISKYGTTLSRCNCPDYQYRQAKVGGACKHMMYLSRKQDSITVIQKAEAKFDEEDFRGKGMGMDEAADKYGDSMLILWSKRQLIFKDRFKWRLLE